MESISSLLAALFDLDFTFLVFSISRGNPKMIIVVIDCYLSEHNDLKY